MNFELSSINFLPAGLGVIVSFAFGFVWFNFLFQKPYQKELGKSQKEMDKGASMTHALILQLLGFTAMAFVLSWIISVLAEGPLEGFILGVLVWLGFVASVMGPLYAFQAFSLKLFAITGGYYLICLAFMGALMGAL